MVHGEGYQAHEGQEVIWREVVASDDSGPKKEDDARKGREALWHEVRRPTIRVEDDEGKN
jgi:hypothetical protein